MIRRLGCAWRLSLAVLLVAAVGCGGKPKGSLSGKVTWQGQPVPGGRLLFQPATGPQLSTDITEAGTYSLSGVPVGEYMVGVDNSALKLRDAPLPANAPKDAPRPSEAPGMPKLTGTYVPLPEAYRSPDKSGEKVTVKPGAQTVDVNFK